MADTKRGREEKGLRDARAAELRVVEADIDAMRDGDEVEFYEDADVDPADVVPYLVDDPENPGTLVYGRTDGAGTDDGKANGDGAADDGTAADGE